MSTETSATVAASDARVLEEIVRAISDDGDLERLLASLRVREERLAATLADVAEQHRGARAAVHRVEAELAGRSRLAKPARDASVSSNGAGPGERSGDGARSTATAEAGDIADAHQRSEAPQPRRDDSADDRVEDERAAVPVAAAWPRGSRSAPIHERANYPRIIGCVAAGLRRPAEIRDALGMKQSATQEALRELVKHNILAKPDADRPSYTLTDKGRELYAELAAKFGGPEAATELTT